MSPGLQVDGTGEPDSLAEVLRWEDCCPPLRIIGAARRDLAASMAAAVITGLGQLPDGASRRLALDALGTLSDDDLQRVLLAPSIGQAARAAPSRPLPSVASIVMLEAAIAGGRQPEVGGWSALGDRWIGLAPTSAYRTPPPTVPVPCHLPVDVSLPELLVCPSAGLRTTVRLDDDGLATAAGMIDAALTSLEARAPAAHALVTGWTANVVLRQEANRPPIVRSASSPMAVGRTVLINVLGANGPADVEDVEDALVHEATHAFLSAAEIRQPFITGDESLPARSPWTGDTLPLRALIHACYVWFGLQWLWRRRHGCCSSGTAIDRKMEHVRQGFTSLDPASLRAAAANPSVVADIDQLRREVLAL